MGTHARPAVARERHRRIDLGLLRENENHALVPGNPMYAEIILRYLSATEQKRFYNDYRQPFWLKDDGSLTWAR